MIDLHAHLSVYRRTDEPPGGSVLDSFAELSFDCAQTLCRYLSPATNGPSCIFGAWQSKSTFLLFRSND